MAVNQTPPDPGRDDKAIADALQVLAEAVAKLTPAPPPPPPPPPPAPTPIDEPSLVRRLLAYALTGIPSLLAQAVVGVQAPTDPVERAEALKAVREQRRRGSEDRELGAGGGLVGRGAATAGAVGGLLAARFAAVLGPLAVFGQVLSANNSGMSVLQRSVGLLGATLAPLLLPVAIVLAAALVELSDQLQGELTPAISEWSKLVLSAAPHLLALAQAAARAAGALAQIAGAPKAGQELSDAANEGFVRDMRRTGKSRDEVEKSARDAASSDWRAAVPGVGGQKWIDEQVKRALAEYDRQDASAQRTKQIVQQQRAQKDADEKAKARTDKAIELIAERGGNKDSIRLVGEDSARKGIITPGEVPRYTEAGERAVREIEGYVGRAVAQGHPRENVVEDYRRQLQSDFQREVKFAPGFDKQLLEIYDRIKSGTAPAAAGGATPAVAAPTAGSASAPAAAALGAAVAPPTSGRDALRDVIQSLRLSLTPQAKFTNLTDVGRQVQLKALNGDPIDQRVLDRLIRSVEVLEKIEANTSRDRAGGAPPITTDGSKPR